MKNFKWASFILFLATVYNLVWGAVISLKPELLYFNEIPSNYDLILARCIGMLVGLYGVAYYVSSKNPTKYASLILIGLIGKILGPIGAIFYVIKGQLSIDFLLINIFNDFIWWIPFGWILFQVYKGKFAYPNDSSEQSLYQQILGNNYDKLSPNLKEFHQAKLPIKAQGKFKIERGKTFINNLIANIADLPKASESETVELSVKQIGNTEIWSRKIGDKMVESIQWKSEKFLVEKFGLVHLYLLTSVENNNLHITDCYASIFGIPFPPFFTPKVIAFGKDSDIGMYVDIDIKIYPFGRIIHYFGVVKIVE